MKKFINLIIISTFLTVSCNDESESIEAKDHHEISSLYNDLNQEVLELAVSSLSENLMSAGQYEFSFDQRSFVENILQGVNGEYIELPSFYIEEFSESYEIVRLPDYSVNGKIEKLSTDLSEFELYTAEQLNLLQPYVDLLIKTNDLDSAQLITQLFEEEIIESEVNELGKTELLIVSSSVLAMIEFAKNDGINTIDELVIKLFSDPIHSNGRFADISWGDVWASGVVGLAAGAVQGAYVGATVGTATFPIVGTVTGGVSAGVVGGALGFITGSTSSIAATLIRNCIP